MPLDVQLANRLAQAAFDGADGPLPARAVFGDAVERRTVEGKLRIDQLLVQQVRVAWTTLHFSHVFQVASGTESAIFAMAVK